MDIMDMLRGGQDRTRVIYLPKWQNNHGGIFGNVLSWLRIAKGQL